MDDRISPWRGLKQCNNGTTSIECPDIITLDEGTEYRDLATGVFEGRNREDMTKVVVNDAVAGPVTVSGVITTYGIDRYDGMAVSYAVDSYHFSLTKYAE